MTLDEINAMEIEAFELLEEAKDWRALKRVIIDARRDGVALIANLNLPNTAVQGAITEVIQPLRDDIIRAAEVHCQEQARRAFLRASLLRNQIDQILNAGREHAA